MKWEVDKEYEADLHSSMKLRADIYFIFCDDDQNYFSYIFQYRWGWQILFLSKNLIF